MDNPQTPSEIPPYLLDRLNQLDSNLVNITARLDQLVADIERMEARALTRRPRSHAPAGRFPHTTRALLFISWAFSAFAAVVAIAHLMNN